MKKIEIMDELLHALQEIQLKNDSEVHKLSCDEICSISSALYSLIAEKKKENDILKSFSCIMAQSFRNSEINVLLAKLLVEANKEELVLTNLLDTANNFR